MSTIAERLSLGNEMRQLKLGKSFRQKPAANSSNNLDYNGEAFHTIRYDFKPASVDSTKMATLEFGDNNKATVTMPNVEGSGLAHTIFTGSRKPHYRECVIIVDKQTGEITMERLNYNINVKQTRAEGTSKAQLLQRPITPSIETNGKKTSPPLSGSQQQTQQQNQFAFQNATQKSLSPKGNENSMQNSKMKKSMQLTSNAPANQYRSSTSNTFTTPSQSTVRQQNKEDDMIGMLSESSSESSGNDSSDSDEEIPKTQLTNGNCNTNSEILIGEMSQSDSSSSDEDSDSNSDSSDDENGDENIVESKAGNNSSILPSMPNMTSNQQNMQNGSGLLSMPKFSQLSQDLQLSESGSDSD
ncbi:ELL-associated factor 1-like protein [Dinothrombium tinctorium]|uniref:Ell-associated factor Eaf n=1 Tax=Dinothrombium tinctorium TaxID=1965070 RepID=A0A3S3Q396_9ACAR|nr:ELL-associated factor 1-like protein [Dinothrombium tinctorium]RWS13136.1 ELL-associated factor 1-like protein [Dinothrombium tinctorium]RWS13689.1 ELL-associated factor 1-like protein [Dinothrombium tinctorium]